MFANELIDIRDHGEAVDWSFAACRAAEASLAPLFFSEQIDDIARAKGICTTCVLQAPCLEGALARREPWGVWGGQLFANGKILAQKRKRGRPPKIRPVEVVIGGVPEAQSA
jgi:WhiB family redox-sensing transcriptional regulator